MKNIKTKHNLFKSTSFIVYAFVILILSLQLFTSVFAQDIKSVLENEKDNYINMYCGSRGEIKNVDGKQYLVCENGQNYMGNMMEDFSGRMLPRPGCSRYNPS